MLALECFFAMEGPLAYHAIVLWKAYDCIKYNINLQPEACVNGRCGVSQCIDSGR